MEQVSVVVPTVGRPSLAAAVDSALAQEGVSVEVIVVVDGRRADVEPVLRSRPGVVLLETGGGRGGSGARALGTDAATSPWISFLDDDDIWRPQKSARQLEAARRAENPDATVVSCRVASSVTTGPVVRAPATLYDGGGIPTYLFRKRRLGADRALVHTSTIFMPTAMAQAVQWTQGLRRHQDWDFILRCERAPGFELVQLPDVLVEVAVASEGSISRSDDWKESLAWYRDVSTDWPLEARQDFVVGQILRYAIAARSIRGVRAALKELTIAPFPSINALALALSGLLPARLFSDLMHRRREARR